MAAILPDIDGVLHVSGELIRGAGPRQLRENGHRLRFVTNNTTQSSRTLVEGLRLMAELEDDELRDDRDCGRSALAGKRVSR